MKCLVLVTLHSLKSGCYYHHFAVVAASLLEIILAVSSGSSDAGEGQKVWEHLQEREGKERDYAPLCLCLCLAECLAHRTC